MNQDASEGGAAKSAARRAAKAGGRRARPVRRFVLVLVGLMVSFNLFFYLWFSDTSAFDSYLALNARVSADVLRLFGEEATSTGVSVNSPRYALTIKRGCDAIQASVFFALLVAASPLAVSIRQRVAWMIGGTLLLLFVNLVRIISLYYTGVWYPSLFEVMHVEVWQMVFIVLPILLWLYWIRRIGKRAALQHNAST